MCLSGVCLLVYQFCLYCNQLLDSLSVYMLAGLIACCLVAFLPVLSFCIFMHLLVVLCLFLHFCLFLAAIPEFSDCVQQEWIDHVFVLKISNNPNNIVEILMFARNSQPLAMTDFLFQVTVPKVFLTIGK